MENVEILSSAANLYNKGKVVYRKEADQLIQENIESINLTFLGERDFPRLPRGEKFATIVAMGLHPASNTIAFEFLLDIIPEALEESSAFSYRLLSAIKRLLLRGIWSDSILKHQKNLSMFPEIGNRDVQVAANAVLRLIELHNDPKAIGKKITKSNPTHKIIDHIKSASSELQEAIKQEHSETRKVIKKPVISSKHKFNCLVTLYPIQREILFELGFNDITIKLPKTKFELFNAIADHNAKSKGWADWERIALKVPQWSNNNKINKSPDYVRSRIIDLRKELPSELDGFIEGKQGHGYRLSTHPDNIYFDKAQL